ncbi:uncharacterized protein LOC105701419 [Orussus abietinus]|uniref:uncharacterized protein LOC105701419 n=1 Tax=Orussus abietinus TaxID=222816 RepID=UPI0006260522|nr:uncharacterized protein LOC105701419 [Orussus abietinus]
MAGIITGPGGHIVGAAIQALVGGIPLGENGSKALNVLRDVGVPTPPPSWFTPKKSDEQKAREVYDKLEMHLDGALKVLKPAMEIKKILENERSLSADRPQSQPSVVPAQYYTPQIPQKLYRDKSHCQNKEKSTLENKNLVSIGKGDPLSKVQNILDAITPPARNEKTPSPLSKDVKNNLIEYSHKVKYSRENHVSKSEACMIYREPCVINECEKSPCKESMPKNAKGCQCYRKSNKEVRCKRMKK